MYNKEVYPIVYHKTPVLQTNVNREHYMIEGQIFDDRLLKKHGHDGDLYCPRFACFYVVVVVVVFVVDVVFFREPAKVQSKLTVDSFEQR